MKSFQLIARVNRGGTAVWIDNLVSGLRKLGHDVELFAGEVEENEVEDDCFNLLGGRRINNLRKSISLIDDIKSIFEFRKVLKTGKPDVLNTHTAKAGLIGRVAAIGLPIRVVHTYHGHVLYGYFPKHKLWSYTIIEKVLSRFTDKFVAVGYKVKTELLDAGIGKPDQYLVIYPGVEKLDIIDERVARSELKAPLQGILVGWLGRFTRIKRPDRFLELARKNPNTTFIMGGEGELLSECKNLATKNVIFPGWVSPEIFWSACDLAVLTSDNEGLPTALIEAGFASVPILTPNVGSAAEIVSNQVSGIVINEFKELDLVFQKLIRNKVGLQKMGKNSFDFCVEKFSLQQFILSHINVYLN
jgi:glycosyltransferase involved in cell wall biosynthesis